MKKVLSFFLKRKLLSFFILSALVIILFKGSIYRSCVSYKIIAERNADNFSVYSGEPRVAHPQKNAEEIIDFALDTTADLLSFTSAKCVTDGFLLLDGGKTNCIGYADLCSLRCRLEFRKNKLQQYVSGTYVAQLYIFGYNIHHLFSDPFWKDHDVVVITNTTTGERILLDPTLYDYTGVGIVRERK